MSEAVRLAIERADFLSCLNAEAISLIAEEYHPILDPALSDLDYSDYRTVARSLPALIAGYIQEQENRGWRSEIREGEHLDPSKLVELLNGLDVFGRIGVLDCVVAERNRRANPPVEE